MVNGGGTIAGEGGSGRTRYTCIYIYVRKHMYTYVCTCIYVEAYTYMYTYMCTYLHIWAVGSYSSRLPDPGQELKSMQ